MNLFKRKFFFPSWWFIQCIIMLLIPDSSYLTTVFGILLCIISFTWHWFQNDIIRTLLHLLLIGYSVFSWVGMWILLAFSPMAKVTTWVLGLTVPTINVLLSMAAFIREKILCKNE